MKTGFIGLGAMGLSMARNLHKAGLLHGVWNRTAARAAELAAETGCRQAADPAALAAEVEALVICVSADADVLGVVDALAPGARPGLVVVDCSTVSAVTAREAAARLARRGVGFLDCPVSGGVEGARNGTLAIMCGGDPATFERARPVLAAMGRAITHMGPTGYGQATKATNQILCAGVIQAVAEAMAFAKAEGLALDKVIEALSTGAGSSWYFVNRAPFMARGSYPAGFRVRLHDKDLGICHDMAAAHGVSLPVVETTRAQYRELMAAGHGDEDISTLFRLKDALFGAGR
ncbi:MAG: NAD(P)-dependent oxidoreductase [Proteobacteria bacterium]|nr:NAD(P)-dependent oxidoreductase [Pseudomonadota bacterium]